MTFFLMQSTVWAIPNEAKLIITLNEHSGNVNSIAFSPDGTLLASASDDSTIKLWHVTEPKYPMEIITLTSASIV